MVICPLILIEGIKIFKYFGIGGIIHFNFFGSVIFIHSIFPSS
ncbi:hypothetical protein SLEP1_g36846 [Rubroshorea leprosula]|uniref:Uncharacterized protein n=1 Tax=Rubroshorea leprosula TaxID=152421 RepID=A0AAV5KSR1_9ROSI|nr:hypothetical protein SLEP1_g36846 [Rubroshorea leprosula]